MDTTPNPYSSKVVLQTQGLTKKYGNFVALHDLNLEVYQGEIFGYLGPNGAGKTTTIRTLLDLIRPTSGSATILGMDSRRDSVKIHTQLGFLPSEMTLYHNMTGRQYVHFIERARAIMCMKEAERLAEKLDYDLNRSLEGLSTGNRRKMGLITALMHRPPLLILDEPTSGLDPLMQQIFNELIREIQADGRTVFLSSHNLPEVETLCDRIAILREGKLTAVEKIETLMSLRFRWFVLDFEQAVNVQEFRQLPNVTALETNPESTHLRLQVSGEVDPLIKLAARYSLRDLTVEHPSLEETFLEFYGNGKKSSSAAATKDEVQL